jgi:hypothetical protein
MKIRRKILPLISLSAIGIVLAFNLMVSAQTSLPANQLQCSVSPIERVAVKPSLDKQGKPILGASSSQDKAIQLRLSQVSTDFNTGGLTPVSLGDRIRVTVTHLSDAINNGYLYTFDQDSQTKILNPFNYQNLVLQLNGYSLNSIHGSYIAPDQLEFELSGFNESKDAWRKVFGNALNATRNVTVSVGCSDGQSIPLDRADSKIELTILLWQSLRGFIILIPIIVLVASFLIGFKSTLLRGIGVTSNRAYSLGRTQLAWWSYLIFFSFLGLFAITGSYTDIVSSQSMVLLGLGAATTLGSSVIDSEKKLTLEQEAKLIVLDQERKDIEKRISSAKTRQERNQQAINLQKKIEEMDQYELQSKGFIRDLITGSKGEINLHRYQIFIWTIVLGLIFIYEVLISFKMPEFDTTLLALQGISAGTFLTLKAQAEFVPIQNPSTSTSDLIQTQLSSQNQVPKSEIMNEFPRGVLDPDA